MSSTAKKKKSAASAKRSKSSNGKPTTPRDVRHSQTADGWESWSRHLAQRKKPAALRRILPSGRKSPFLWAISPDASSDAVVDLIQSLETSGQRRVSKRLDERLESWLDHPQSREANAAFGYQCLAWCHALPRLAAELAAGPWWQLFDKLFQVAESSVGADQQAADPLASQLLAGELPLALAYLFPEIDRCGKLAKPALRNISDGLENLLDGEGLPRASHLPLARPLMASWTRSLCLDRERGGKGVGGDALLQFGWLVRQVMRTARFDGSQMMSVGKSGPVRRMFEAALQLTSDKDDARIAESALPFSKPTCNRGNLPECDARSEWANIAILRSAWSRSSSRLLVTYHQRELHSELCSGRNVIWSGNCDPQFQVDGTPLAPTSDWEEVCWHTDTDVSFVELECQLSEGWRVQRQWLLARGDGFLYAADAIIREQPANDRIEYRCTWPLAEGIHFAGEVDTREGVLENGKPFARVIPLSLPEWRAERVDASLARVDGGLQLFQTGRGRGLHAALFVDLKPRRVARPLTWRRLTVAEKLQIQPADVAVGYRVQIGKAQWLVYRSLAAAANRTVLGQNFSTEMHVGRFKKTGESEELLGIE